MSGHARTTAGFWAAVVVVSLLILYPLSFGPACWLHSRTAKGGAEMAVFYWPIGRILTAHNHASELVSWYGCLAAEDGEVGIGWSPEDGPVWYVPFDCLLIDTNNAVAPAETLGDPDRLDEPLHSHPVPDYADPPQLRVPADE
jgi:hypothetical protein